MFISICSNSSSSSSSITAVSVFTISDSVIVVTLRHVVLTQVHAVVAYRLRQRFISEPVKRPIVISNLIDLQYINLVI